MTHAPTSIADAVAEIKQSRKFQDWGKLRLEDIMNPAFGMDEQHYTPQELAKIWGVSAETIRVLFRDEPGVLKIGKDGTRFKRGYRTLRIPESVAERVHTRLSA